MFFYFIIFKLFYGIKNILLFDLVFINYEKFISCGSLFEKKPYLKERIVNAISDTLQFFYDKDYGI